MAALKNQSEPDLLILGSGALTRSLIQRNLIDEYSLLIHPLILGTGNRLFPEGSPFTALRLIETRISTTGVVIATHRPAEKTTAHQ